MESNLRLFAGQIETIKLQFESKMPLSREEREIIKGKVELEQLYLQLADGNYNLKMLERAIYLADKFESEGRVAVLRGKLHELKAEGKKETGSRARSEILDQLAVIIVNNINPYGARAKDPLNYLVAVKELDRMMTDNDLHRGDSEYSEYDEGLKEAWVIVREKMYQQYKTGYGENRKRETVSRYPSGVRVDGTPKGSKIRDDQAR
jgi:hypothetical protein